MAFPIDMLRMRKPVVSGGTLDTQTVTTGTAGTSPNRERGYSSLPYGTINDGTSNIYAGATITDFYWSEGLNELYLVIPGAANSGWTQVDIGGIPFTRASAAYSAGTWTWPAVYTVATNPFGAAGSIKTCTFT